MGEFMRLTNLDIFNYSVNLIKEFGVETATNVDLPIYAIYVIQYNINQLSIAYDLIQRLRSAIGQRYGNYNIEDETYYLDEDKINIASEEMDKILADTQEIDLKLIPLSLLLQTPLTQAQMAALIFMIEDDVSINRVKGGTSNGSNKDDDKS